MALWAAVGGSRNPVDAGTSVACSVTSRAETNIPQQNEADPEEAQHVGGDASAVTINFEPPPASHSSHRIATIQLQPSDIKALHGQAGKF